MNPQYSAHRSSFLCVAPFFTRICHIRVHLHLSLSICLLCTHATLGDFWSKAYLYIQGYGKQDLSGQLVEQYSPVL